MIKLILDSIRKSTKSEHNILIFQEEGGERCLPIWIGPCETQTILAKLENQPHEEIPTFAYFKQFLSHGDLKVEHVQIHSLVNNIYHAEITTTRRKLLTKEIIKIDCRPADATTLSLYFDVPIYASTELMEKHSIKKEEPWVSTLEGTAEQVDPYNDFWQNFIDLE